MTSPPCANKLAAKWGPVRLGNPIQYVRSVFKYAYDAGLIDRPVRFGPGFKRPSKKTLRLHRAKQGPKLFTADEVRRLIDAAGTAAQGDDPAGDQLRLRQRRLRAPAAVRRGPRRGYDRLPASQNGPAPPLPPLAGNRRGDPGGAGAAGRTRRTPNMRAWSS